MMLPAPHCSPYDSAHHRDTTPGDTFGNLGTDREYREEDTRAALQVGKRTFVDLGRAIDDAGGHIIAFHRAAISG